MLCVLHSVLVENYFEGGKCMKILLMEGNEDLRRGIVEWFELSLTPVTAVSNLYDAIYYLFYSDEEFDMVMIGDELETSVEDTSSLEEELGALLQRLEDCRYFSVEFGKICIDLCKMKKKTEPKIAVVTTSCYYEFLIPKAERHPNMNFEEEIRHLVESNGMTYVDVHSKDFCGELCNIFLN